MIWQLTGNSWLDNWLHKVVEFNNELNSCACKSSPLDAKDIEDIKKCIEKLNKINIRVSKRLNKKKK